MMESKMIIFICIASVVYLNNASELTLNSANRFDRMLVYINDDVLEGDGSLLQNIKDHLNKASQSLLKATGNMQEGKAGVQFGTIYIRVPKTWSVPGDPITWQHCNKADFYITVPRDNNNQSEPFTKQLGKCGEPSNFTRFSEDFFKRKNDKDLIRAGKEIMKEFVKLRYGVFSEKPYSNVLTVFTGLGFINSTCGPNINWTINQPQPLCSERNKICSYTLDPEQSHNYSIMFDSDSSGSEYFCNDNNKPHNKYARSLHNIKCNRQSVSSVILRHQDFSVSKNSEPFQTVDFKVIKGQDRKIAMVLDVSGSMASIIDNMRKAVVEFIQNTIEDTASVGVASFSDYASILSYTQIMTASNRQSLIGIINGLQAGGYTNMGDGLAKGVAILGGDIGSNDKVFGTILLLSDGGNNRDSPYRYDYAIDQVIKKGVVVNTICYGTAADEKLSKLAKGNGGYFLFADPRTTYSELMGKFAIRQSCEKSTHLIKMIEDTVTVNVTGGLVEFNLTSIDKYIGENVQITLTFTHDISRYTILLVTPSNKQIKQSKTITQSSGTTLTFNIPGIPDFGMYKIRTMSNSIRRYRRSVNTISVTFRVSATPQAKSSRIINPTGELSSSEIETLTDTSTIQATIDLTTCGIEKNENVSVYLTMITPSKSSKVMIMTDDGLGDDNIENDKIFTRTLIAKQLNEAGFYNFLAHTEIKNTNTSNIIRRTVELGSMRVKQLSVAPIQDKVTPAKIEDVTVAIISSVKKEISVDILATGNDGMIGNISVYEIKIKYSKDEIVIVKNSQSSPGMRIRFNIELSKYNVTNPFDVLVRGVDDKNNAGEWSLSKTSNWNYEAIAQKFSDNVQPRSYASKMLFSIVYVCFTAIIVVL